MFRAIDKWLAGYLSSVIRRPGNVQGTKHLMFCVADHFEPFWQKAPKERAVQIVARWAREFPAVAGKYHDADGRTPQHTFFYPSEEYNEECVAKLADICRRGFGEVEIHLHHRNDTKEGFRSSLEVFRDMLRREHGLLGDWKVRPDPAKRWTCDAEILKGKEKKVAYGFIHGNWALCNSRPDGDWCGVNEELGVLHQTGCYADFTFPSAPSPTQPRMVNAIYRAVDTPGRPRACDQGKPVISKQLSRLCSGSYAGQAVNSNQKSVKVGESTVHSPQSLMLITGPLAFDWHRRKWGVFPRLENGAITSSNPPSPGRIDLWTNQHIHIEGCPNWVFVKAYTHGCQQANADILLGNAMRKAYDHLLSSYNDGRQWSLHFVTARELYNIVRAAEDGNTGNPGDYRDYEILPPPGKK